jgi:lysophospholipid acyltransferase (LPLAT)-like uncharacterized protein
VPNERTPNLVTRIGGRLTSAAVKAWMSTLDYRAALYDPSADPALPSPAPRIYVFWHENILLPLYLRGGCNMAILLSRHRDADILAEVARHAGLACVRGSTYRGAAPAIRELLRSGRQRHLVITPDGPRGPRRRLAQGAIYLASKLQMPIVAIGVGYDRPWRTPTWDRFAVPRPFCRARAIVSPAMHLPRDLDRAQVETCRERLETLLGTLSDEAEAWATTSARMPHEIQARKAARPRMAA